MGFQTHLLNLQIRQTSTETHCFVNRIVRLICAAFWYNRANDGKGVKFGTNEADVIQINDRIGGILKLSYFWQNFNVSISNKDFIIDPKTAKAYFSNLVCLRNKSYS